MMVAGFGFRSNATLASLLDALMQTVAAMPPAVRVRSIVLLATAHDKADAACLRELAEEMGLPVVAVAAVLLNATPTLTESFKVRALRGSGSTAEASALAAAQMQGWQGATLLHPRAVSTDRLATCAFAALAPQRKN